MATIRWSAVMLGVGLGVLALALSALALWLILSAVGMEGAAGAATTFATLVGFAVAGWVAGRRAPTSLPFHGALAALILALAVLVTSIFGGSSAPTAQVLLLALLAMVVGGTSATLSSRFFIS